MGFMVSTFVSHCKASRRSGYKNIASIVRPCFRKMSRLSCRISMFIDEQITSSQYQSFPSRNASNATPPFHARTDIYAFDQPIHIRHASTLSFSSQVHVNKVASLFSQCIIGQEPFRREVRDKQPTVVPR